MKNIYKFLLLLLLIIPLYASAVVEMSDKVFVTDAADLLTDESEEYIMNYSEFLYKAEKIDYFVVTVENLEDMSIEEYTNQLFKEFKLNKKGLLILISKEDRKIRIQAGEKLYDIIDANLIDYYIDTYFMPFLQNGDWNEGIINGYSAFYKYLCKEFDIDASEMDVVDNIDFFTKYKNILLVGILVLIMVFANHYGKFFKKMKVRNPLSIKELFILILMVVLNIFALSVAFIIKPIYLLLIFLFELLALYLYKDNNKSIKKTRVKKVRKKIRKKKR